MSPNMVRLHCDCIRVIEISSKVNIHKAKMLVLEMVRDCHFESGSSLDLHCHQIGSLGCQYTPTVISGTVGWKYLNPSELSGLSAGCPAGPSVD